MSALLAVVSGFSSGVFLRSFFYFSWPPLLFLILIAALFVAGYLFASRRIYLLLALFFLLTAAGAGRTLLADTPLPDAFARDVRHRVAYEGTVTADPDVREKNQRIALEVDGVGMLTVMPLSARVHVGDRVRVFGTLVLPQAFQTENGRTFRYDKYLQARGIRFLIEFGTIYAETPAPWYSLPALLARIKHSFLDGLDRALPAPESALAGGIVIGGKQGLPRTVQDAFTRSGLVQIIVLSGYNVMIVAEWMMAFLAMLLLPRRLQFFAGGAALLLFVGIAGISATAVRAAIMAIIALYARATGRSYAASRSLLLAVLLMLIIDPLYLAFDPGFGLSVAATAGIIWLSPPIERRLSRLRPFFANMIATTLAAQLSVLPLLLYNIGTLSLVAVPANLLVNAFVPLAMAVSAGAGVVGMTIGTFFPPLASAAGIPAHILMRYFIFIAQKAAELPFAAVALPPFPFLLVLAAYAALIFIASSKRFSSTLPFRFAKNAST